jgi:hypothetical protein
LSREAAAYWVPRSSRARQQWGRDSASPRRDSARVDAFAVSLREQRAQGRPGAGRTRSLVCSGSPHKNSHQVHHRFDRCDPAFPAQWFYGLSRALLGVRALIATVMREIVHALDPSVGESGPHAFAVRRPHHSSADAAFVHRIPHSTSVTTAKRPSYRGGTGRVSASDLPDGASGKIAASGVTQPKPFEVPSKIGFRRGRLCPLSPSLRARDRRARGGSAGRGVDRRVNQPTSSETSGRIIIVRQLIAVRC